MKSIYKSHCFFYQLVGSSGSCRLSRSHCVACEMCIRRVDGLDLKDHVLLVNSRVSIRNALLFSALSLGISLVSLCMKLLEMVGD